MRQAVVSYFGLMPAARYFIDETVGHTFEWLEQEGLGCKVRLNTSLYE